MIGACRGRLQALQRIIDQFKPLARGLGNGVVAAKLDAHAVLADRLTPATPQQKGIAPKKHRQHEARPSSLTAPQHFVGGRKRPSAIPAGQQHLRPPKRPSRVVDAKNRQRLKAAFRPVEIAQPQPEMTRLAQQPERSGVVLGEAEVTGMDGMALHVAAKCLASHPSRPPLRGARRCAPKRLDQARMFCTVFLLASWMVLATLLRRSDSRENF